MIFQVDPFQRLCTANTGGCSLVQILDEKPLVVTVGSGEHITCSRRIVKLYALGGPQGHTEICKLPFETPVLGVKITTQRYKFFLCCTKCTRLVVVTESDIHIYNTGNMGFMDKISTSPNPKGNAILLAIDVLGLCAVSIAKGTDLAYPCLRGSLTGDLLLYDAVSMIQTGKLEGVHVHPLQHIQFSPDGTSVATASEEGTLIKVWFWHYLVYNLQLTPIDSPEPICVFRRGSRTRADISFIAFNAAGNRLAVSSTKGTTHIFDITQEKEKHKL